MFTALLKQVADGLVVVGDFTLFSLSVLRGILRLAGRGTYVPIFYSIGVNSVGVVCITGLFIGLALAVELYSQFNQVGMATRLGSIINMSVIRQFGPILAATMIAGRVGSAIAAELATMRITDQLDALSCLGVNPTQYLGTPRLLACVLLTPVLTILANFVGVLGGNFVCVFIYHVDNHYYWDNASGFIGLFDIVAGLIKPTVFGIAIGLVSCHRGVNSSPGAEGVGRAATSAFVWSFVAILALNFFVAMVLENVYDAFWQRSRGVL